MVLTTEDLGGLSRRKEIGGSSTTPGRVCMRTSASMKTKVPVGSCPRRLTYVGLSQKGRSDGFEPITAPRTQARSLVVLDSSGATYCTCTSMAWPRVDSTLLCTNFIMAPRQDDTTAQQSDHRLFSPTCDMYGVDSTL